MEKIKVLDIVKKEISDWTLFMVLEEINRGHSNEFTPYDKSDWKEGWKEWVEDEGYFKIVKK